MQVIPCTVIALDLGGHNLRACLVDGEGNISERRAIPTASDRSPEKVMEQIRDVVTELSSVASEPVRGIGLGVPGFIDRKRGVVCVSPNFPGWENFAIYESLKKFLRLPFALENDGNCAALGEWWKGSAQGFHHVICLTLGTGVGGGLILDGVLYRGSRGVGGELGHVIVEPNGPRCGCGGQGCLEQLVSGTALQRKTGKSAEDLFRLARQGDAVALSAFQQLGRYLGIGLASFCYLFDPELIVLGGRVSQAFDFFMPTARMEMDRRLSGFPARETRAVSARLGDNAGLLGAAYAAMQMVWSSTQTKT